MGEAKRRADMERRRLALVGLMTSGQPGRACGSCTACCTTTEVDEPELRKPHGVRCQYVGAAGCGIQENKPAVCAQWLCGWRLGFGRDDERPDMVGYVLEPSRHNTRRGLAPMSLSASDILGRWWMQAADIRRGAGLSAHERLTEIANERGGAIQVAVAWAEDGKTGFGFVGPEADLMAGVAMLDQAKVRLPVLPVPLWRTPETLAAAQRLLRGRAPIDLQDMAAALGVVVRLNG